MSGPADDDLSEADDLLAAELALGVLDAAERGPAEARARAEPVLAAAVARWRRRFGALTPGEAAPDAEPEVEPSAPLWPAIAARLPANDDVPPALRRWRAAALALAAVAASLLLALLLRPPAPVATGSLVAVLAGASPGGVVTVSVDPDGRLLVAPSALGLAPRTAELWVIPADGRPRSLGVIDERVPGRIATAPALRDALAPDATLAITVERPGGAPDGRPSGAPILSGRLLRL